MSKWYLVLFGGALLILGVSSVSLGFNEPDGFKQFKWGTPYHEIFTIPPSGSVPQQAPPYDDKVGDIKITAYYKFLPLGELKPQSRFAAVTLSFDSVDYPLLKITFMERYGKPTLVKDEILRSRMGVEVRNEVLEWKGPKVLVSLRKFGGQIDRGWAEIGLNIYNQEAIRREIEKAKSAAGDL